MDNVVHDRELRVKLGGLVFVDLDVAADEAAVAVPRGGDGRIIVRLGGIDDPRPAAPPDPPDASQHCAGRREISEDHVEPAGILHVPANASPPAVAHAQGPAELPLQRPAPLVILADHPLERAELRSRPLGPAEDGCRNSGSGARPRARRAEARGRANASIRDPRDRSRRCWHRRSAPSLSSMTISFWWLRRR